MRSRPTILLSLWFAGVALYSMLPVRHRTAILTTMGHDLANHVRHVYEAGLALREGQVPPLVCPRLEGGARLPLFQYYSGTSYWAPAVWSLWDSNPYRALKVGVFLHLFAAGWGVYGVGKLLGESHRRVARATGGDSDLKSDIPDPRPAPPRYGVHIAALVAATAFQVAPFSAADLYRRGSYTEFAAMHSAPGVLYCALRVAGTRSWRGSVAWVSGCGLAGAYFIPLHPVQTMLCGVLIAVMAAAYALVDRRAGWPALVKLACAAGLGVAGAAWFWWPVLRDYGELRITPHGAFLDAGLADAGVLLWPWYREAARYPWGPQVGLHFAVAAGVVGVMWKWGRAVGVVGAVAVLGTVGVVLFHERMPAVQRLLLPLQWSYRLLVPATLAGAVCLGLATEAVVRGVGSPRGRVVVGAAALAYVLGTSATYFVAGKREYPVRVRNVVAPTWEAPNSTGSYALRGWDYRGLKIVRDDGLLNVNTDIPVPTEGVETEVSVVVRQLPAGAATSVAVNPAQDPRPLTPTLSPGYWGEGEKALVVRVEGRQGRVEALGEGRVRVRFRVRPRVGHVAGDAVVRFEGAEGWVVEDVTFRAVADDPSMACRIPPEVVWRQAGRVTEMDVEVKPRREGWYQLPVFVLPSNEVEVNGERVDGAPSANNAMVMVRLRSGRDVVTVRTLPTREAWVVSAGAVVAMVLGAGGSMVLGHRRPAAGPL